MRRFLAKLTLGELIALASRIDVHCVQCARLFSEDPEALKLPPETRLTDVEQHLACPNCGGRSVQIKLPDTL